MCDADECCEAGGVPNGAIGAVLVLLVDDCTGDPPGLKYGGVAPVCPW